MELDWTVQTVDGVTLVSLSLKNERTVDRRVRLRNRLDGPVLPPRRQREAEAGWDREGLSTVVPAGSTVAYGYACPAPADQPPVVVTDVGPPDGPVAGGKAVDTGESAADVIRRLGDARPPRAVVGEGISRSDAVAETEQAATPEREDPPKESTRDGGKADDETAMIEIAPPDEETTEGDETDADEAGPGSDPDHTSRSPRPTLAPDFVTALAPYRRRVETVEALWLASVTGASAVLEVNGGIAGVEETGHQLDADAAALRALAVEATALAARAEAATPPTDALRRLS